MKKAIGFAMTASILAGCSSASLKPETHANLTGPARNDAANQLVAAQASDQSMDKFFSGARELKNACIVGYHYKTIVNDNTLNHKSTMDVPAGGGFVTRHTTTFSVDFKPTPAYFQGFTDYGYDVLAATLKAYGYNVIPLETMKKSPAYLAKGDNGTSNYDKTPQYSGYFDHDAHGLRHYDGHGFSAVRTLTADDKWASQLHKETGCELIVNATVTGSWKVKGAGKEQGISALLMDTQFNMGLGFYTPWAVWEKASKEIDKKIYGANNRGGNTALKKTAKADLVYATGDNSGADPKLLSNIAVNTENQIKGAISSSIEYQVRAFHMAVYTKKTIPTDLRALSSVPSASASNN